MDFTTSWYIYPIVLIFMVKYVTGAAFLADDEDVDFETDDILERNRRGFVFHDSYQSFYYDWSSVGNGDPSPRKPKVSPTTDPGTDDPGTDGPGTDNPGNDGPGTDQPLSTRNPRRVISSYHMYMSFYDQYASSPFHNALPKVPETTDDPVTEEPLTTSKSEDYPSSDLPDLSRDSYYWQSRNPFSSLTDYSSDDQSEITPTIIGQPVPESSQNPHRLDKPEVVKFHVQTRITGRYASTVITSKLHNWKNVSSEAEFPLKLPEEAFISDFFMIVGKTIYRSEVKEKHVAQKTYDKAKKEGQTAGQVKQKSPEANEFGISVNVAANQSVTFNLTYQQLLSRRNGVINHVISTIPYQVVDNYKVDIYLTETQGIRFLEAGWKRKSEPDKTELAIDDVVINQQSHRAHITFNPSRQLQVANGSIDQGFNGDVVLRYDVNHDLSAGELQVVDGYFVHHFSPEGLPPVRKSVVSVINVSGSMDSQSKISSTMEALLDILANFLQLQPLSFQVVDGYFVHYFSPEGLPPVRKSVVFVIDVSGSMSGQKMSSTIEALLIILADLKEGDRFNIVTFETRIDVWRDTMLPVTRENIDAAKEFVKTLVALTSTNLHGGIMEGVNILRREKETDISAADTYPMLIMLTDGHPSAGVTEPDSIRFDLKSAIAGEMSLFTLGFGTDVDGTLLEQLALENQGVYREIYVDASATLQLTGFYDEVASPLLYNIDIMYPQNSIDVNSVTETNFISYFQGTELVVAGKLTNEIHVFTASVFAVSRMDNELVLNVSTNVVEQPKTTLSRHTVDDFTQRLWAYKTIKLLLDQMKIATDPNELDSLKAEALQLSLKYKFVTPLTSLVVVKPKKKKKPLPTVLPTVSSADNGGNNQNSQVAGSKRTSPSSRRGGSGGSGGGGGGSQGYADSDPHFLVHIPANDLSVCFDITGNQGEVYNLITDEQIGLSIQGTIVAATKSFGHKQAHTYFGVITIIINTHVIMLSPSQIVIDETYTLSWENIVAMTLQDFTVAVTQNRHVEVFNDEGVNVAFVLHKVKSEYKVDHIGLYINDGDGLSEDVHGLIGHFQYKSIPVVPGSIQISKDKIVTARLAVNGKEIEVQKKNRHNAITKQHQECWFVKGNGKGLLEGHYRDYVI